MKEKYRRLYQWIHEHESRLSWAAFFCGALFDNLTLTRVDMLLDNIIIIFYLTLTGTSIILLNLYEARLLRGKVFDFICPWLPIVLQFAFGGLFSVFFVFYSRSASLVSSWLFLIILLVLLFGNEMFKHRYEGFTFQMNIFFVAVYAYMIFLLPVLLGAMNAFVFIASGLVSLVIVGGILYWLSRKVSKNIQHAIDFLIITIGGIFVTINALYFLNIIPPIPLSLKQLDVYHSVGTSDRLQYTATYERKPWYKILLPGKKEHVVPGQPLYAFSSVFAPTRLATDIVHRWQFRDDKNGWVTRARIQLPISGGRDGGYRTYSLMNNIQPGKWRVIVETPRGQVLGQITFTVESVGAAPNLEVKVL